MKMKSYLLFLSLSVTLACTHSARLYPVQGALASQTPPPVLAAKITGSLTPKDFSAVLSDGEVCRGRFTIVARNPASPSAKPAAVAGDDMPSVKAFYTFLP